MIACLRCGDLVPEEKLPVRGVPLCAGCATGGFVETGFFALQPPAGVAFARVWPAIAFGLLGLAVGALVALRTFAWAGVPPGMSRAEGFAFWLSLVTLVGGLAFFLAAHLASIRRYHVLGNAAWRVAVERTLALPDSHGFAFGLLLRPWDGSWSSFILREPGFLAVGDDGLLYLGGRGSRATFALADITAVAVDRRRSHPRWALRLELRDGKWWRFEPLEPDTLRAGRLKAEELAARIRERLGSRSSGEPGRAPRAQ